ncbi:MAG: CNNM domain-containing protein [Gammaproteobacteria bacterium]|jgi:CBS domain containing-hemolysin-like protein
MLLLFIYIFIALGFSFYCSIAEAVLLSVSRPYVTLLEKDSPHKGKLLKSLKDDINRPLAAILSLNTIAHTMGAAGAGAQAALVFGSAYIGVISAILTLLILVFSEIIPKTLGAHYWRQLAIPVAISLKPLIWILYPFVLLSEKLTMGLTKEKAVKITRNEMAALAELGEREGQLASNESRILKNLFLLRETSIKDIMTPRSVVFSLSDDLKVSEYFERHDSVRFSRIPVYRQHHDNITGFVLRNDLLLAQARGNSDNALNIYSREIKAQSYTTSVLDAYETLLDTRGQILMVIDDFGMFMGIVTLEDILETLLGLEIVDEGDTIPDMQQLARKLWRKRAREMGLDIDD